MFSKFQTSETYKRPSNISKIQSALMNLRYVSIKWKKYGAQTSDDVSDYRLLKNANLKLKNSWSEL